MTARVGEPLQLTMTIYNRTRLPLRVAILHTPFDIGFAETNYLNLRRPDGHEVDYHGRWVYRPHGAPVVAEGYLLIPAWGAVSGTREITQDYRFTEPGDYTIGWSRPVFDIHPDGTFLPPAKEDRRGAWMICTPTTLTITAAPQ